MQDITIRTRITIWFIVIIIVIMAVNFFALFFIGENVARKTTKEILNEIVKSNMEEVSFQKEEPLSSKKNKSTNYTISYEDGYLEIDDFLDLINGVASGLYSSDGDLLYGLNLLPNETKEIDFIDGEIQVIKSGDDTFYVTDRFLHISVDKGIWIRGMIDRANDRQQVYRMYRSFLLTLPIIILIAALAAYIVTYRALSPLKNIVEQVSNINRESDLKYRIKIDPGDNEIGVIVRAINNMLGRLEKSYEDRRKFISKISHDLRTPVTVISAQTEIALDQEIPQDIREAFEVIQRQSKRTSDMLDSQLTYIRYEDMSIMYDKTVIDLSKVVNSTCRSFRVVSDDKIRLKENIDQGIRIKGNEALIYSMLENLINNAFKYTAGEGVVAVELCEKDGMAKLSVSDEGVGIAAEELDKIFEWKYRSKDNEKNEGMGIGLYVVKMIVDMHNAKIEVDSTPGKGSRFTVSFKPYEDDESYDGREQQQK